MQERPVWQINFKKEYGRWPSKQQIQLHEHETQILLAVMNGHNTMELIMAKTGMAEQETNAAMNRLNVESMKENGKPFFK